MNSFKRRQFLRLFGLASGATLLPIASHTASSKPSSLMAQLAQANEVLGELTNKPAEYGQELYWFSFMGQPSARRQFDENIEKKKG